MWRGWRREIFPSVKSSSNRTLPDLGVHKILCFQKMTTVVQMMFFQATIREDAVAALRAALVVTSQREIKQKDKPHYYKVSPPYKDKRQ